MGRHWLLEADEEIPLRDYLDDGELLEIRAEGATVGVALLLRDGSDRRRSRTSRSLSSTGAPGSGARRSSAIVASAPRDPTPSASSVGPPSRADAAIAFYRACGFTDAGRREGFFDAYPEPIVEDGVRAHDMLLFERVLGPRGAGAREPGR